MSERDGPRDACTTYIDQTKLLVTLASAFVVAPAAVIPFFAGQGRITAVASSVRNLIGAESAFVLSVLAGYFVLATIAGSQHKTIYNVYRPMTMFLSLAQIFSYVAGLGLFVRFVTIVINTGKT
jgi:hypothetical protein